MNAGECRRKAQHFLTLSRQMSRPKDRAAMVEMGPFGWGGLNALSNRKNGCTP
jgi:hypothetical protein